MFVRPYRYLKAHLDRLRQLYSRGEITSASYYARLLVLRTLMQLIVFPHFLLLGPFKTFTTFARKDDRGSWLDSYNEFVISNRITLTGVISLILIAVVAVLVFIYLPIFYI
jgi:hypothetical protein